LALAFACWAASVVGSAPLPSVPRRSIASSFDFMVLSFPDIVGVVVVVVAVECKIQDTTLIVPLFVMSNFLLTFTLLVVCD